MVSEKSSDPAKSSARRTQSEGVDPLDELTEPMLNRAAPIAGHAADERDLSDTSTWSASVGAPKIVDDDIDDTETIISAGPAALFPSKSPGPRASDQRALRAPLAPSSKLRPMLLERFEPSLGRGERLRLDAAHWQISLGRAEESDVRLYSASASREHASIAGNQAGEWVLSPATGRSVLIDGEMTAEPVVLEVGMNIILGQDHLRCVTEGIAPRDMVASTAAEGVSNAFQFKRFSPPLPTAMLGLVALIVAFSLGLVVYFMLGG